MIQEQIRAVRATLPADVSLVAVSKFHPLEALEEAYAAGQRVFGESHVQEMQAKQAAMPADVQWHFIGHLQTNKVKYIVPYVSLIHAVDSFRLLEEINKQAGRIGRTVSCLLQLHVAREETKFGFLPDECREMLECGAWKSLASVRICGLMCMASNVDDTDMIRSEFRRAYDFFKEVRRQYFVDSPSFSIRSWGMSHDYPIAVEEGSNMVRIGSLLFGERQY